MESVFARTYQDVSGLLGSYAVYCAVAGDKHDIGQIAVAAVIVWQGRPVQTPAVPVTSSMIQVKKHDEPFCSVKIQHINKHSLKHTMLCHS